MRNALKQWPLIGLVAASLVVATLTGCGGGGGSSTPIPPTAPATIKFASSSPADGAKDVAIGSTIVVNVTTSGTGITANPSGTVACAGSNGSTTATIAGNTVTFTPTAAMPYATACTFSFTIRDNTGTVTGSINFTTVANTWWPPQTIYPQGAKVANPQMISPASLSTSSVSWQNDVKNGVVKFIDTDAMYQGKKVLWAYYIDNLSKGYCTAPVYRDSGSSVVQGGVTVNAGIGCNTSSNVWAVGTAIGIIRYASDRNACYQLAIVQHQDGTYWLDDNPVACPF